MAQSGTAPVPPGKTGGCGESSSPDGGGALAAGGGNEGGVREGRSLKGAAPDEENSSVASLLRARLGR